MSDYKTSYGPYDLKPYQVEAAFTGGCYETRDAFREYPGVFPAWDAGDTSVLLDMATGCGKTIIMGAIASHEIKQRNGRILLLSERRKLVHQGVDKFLAMGLKPDVEMADKRAIKYKPKGPDRTNLVIASVPTLMTKDKRTGTLRINQFPPDYFSSIFVDECHHGTNDRHRLVYGYFKGYKLLGVTATAESTKGHAVRLDEVFKKEAYVYGLDRAIRDGSLCRIKCLRIETSIDLGTISISRGDYTEQEVSAKIVPRIGELAKLFAKYYQGRKSIAFLPDVPSAEYFAKALSELGVSARAISSRLTNKDGEEVTRAFTRDEFKVIVCNEVLVEGYDEDSIACVAFIRPTKLWRKMMQMLGRGTRLFFNKDRCLCLDFAFLTKDHEFECVHPIDMFARPDLPVPVLHFAKSILDSGVQKDPMEAIEKAERIYRERANARISKASAGVAYKVFEFDPFEGGDLIGVQKTKVDTDMYWGSPAADWQVMQLLKLGIKDGHKLSFRGAHRRLKEFQNRKDADLGNLRMVAKLVGYGMSPEEARRLSFADAMKEIARCDALARKSHQTPPGRLVLEG